MSNQKVSIPGGTRDFSPSEVIKRNHIINTIRQTFEQFGFEPLETPAMENTSTLLGKYGDEGDKLLFRVVNNGSLHNFAENNQPIPYQEFTTKMSDRALRYDLTVPFARYVVMHRNDIVLPFKRYQIQPVWRGDSPSKGRYREFWQCDADVVGSDSLLLEAEFVSIYDTALSKLGFTNFTIKINNRKLLQGIIESIGEEDNFISICNSIDKLDKIGIEGVEKELQGKNVSSNAISNLLDIIQMRNSPTLLIGELKQKFKDSNSDILKKGIEEITELFNNYLNDSTIKPQNGKYNLDLTLARGLNYYTGTIFEVVVNNFQMGSIGGGGRYDDLTGIFGWKGLSGVGISFGADRIYDVMNGLELFQGIENTLTDIVFINFGNETMGKIFEVVNYLRNNGKKVEIYPDAKKMDKQFSYADKKKIKYVGIIGVNELANNLIIIKDMFQGKQISFSIEDFLQNFKTILSK